MKNISITQNLIRETLSKINQAVTHIYTNIDRQEWDSENCLPEEGQMHTEEQRELVDTFNELVVIEQRLIDILYPDRHKDGNLPNPKFLYFELDEYDNWKIIEGTQSYDRSKNWERLNILTMS